MSLDRGLRAHVNESVNKHIKTLRNGPGLFMHSSGNIKL